MDSVSPRKIERTSVLLLIGFLGACLAAGAVPFPQKAGLMLSQQARLQPADLAGGDRFGGGVMSADGRTLLLPALFQDCSLRRLATARPALLRRQYGDRGFRKQLQGAAL